MKKTKLPEKKLPQELENYSPEVLWEILVKNHSEWLYNNKEKLNKYITVSFLD